MLTAVEYLGSVGLGVTVPRVFRADDGNIYVVKLQNNPMGTKAVSYTHLTLPTTERV